MIERRGRDPGFRPRVLRAYEWRCAVCDFDGRLADQSFAVEAAHIRWHSYEGSSSPDNGLALCSFHHKAFDLGAIGQELISQPSARAADCTDRRADWRRLWAVRSVGLRADLDDAHRVLVSQDVHGGSRVDDLLLRYSGHRIRAPITPDAAPASRHIAWHSREVFRHPARPFVDAR